MIPIVEAAELLGCTPRHICKLLNTAKLRGKRLTKHFWLVDRRSLNRYAKLAQTHGRPRGSKNHDKN